MAAKRIIRKARSRISPLAEIVEARGLRPQQVTRSQMLSRPMTLSRALSDPLPVEKSKTKVNQNKKVRRAS